MIHWWLHGFGCSFSLHFLEAFVYCLAHAHQEMKICKDVRETWERVSVVSALGIYDWQMEYRYLSILVLLEQPQIASLLQCSIQQDSIRYREVGANFSYFAYSTIYVINSKYFHHDDLFLYLYENHSHFFLLFSEKLLELSQLNF